MRTRLNLAALLVLVFGLTAGLVIFLYADDEPVHPAIYEMSISKTHARELQRLGGKAAVLFDEFNRWFASLWHGKRLGVTIAVLSTGASLILHTVARRVR